MKSNFLKAMKLSMIILIVLLTVSTGHAQKYVLVDVNRILENLDDYKKAQDELDRVAAVWKQEIAVEYDKIKALYNKYQAEQVLLTDEQRKAKEDEIMNKEKDARKMQKDKFGEDGELFKKRQDLVRPIQDKVYAAIQDYAIAKGLDSIFDTSGSAGIIYFNKELDKTEDIIKKLKGTGK